MAAPSEKTFDTSWLQDIVIPGDMELTNEMKSIFQALTEKDVAFSHREVTERNLPIWELTWDIEGSPTTCKLALAHAPELMLDAVYGARIPIISFAYVTVLSEQPVSARVSVDEHNKALYSYGEIRPGYQTQNGDAARTEMLLLLAHTRLLTGEERASYLEKLDRIPWPTRA